MNRSAFRRFEFFDVETVSENIQLALGALPTSAVADGGMLIFGDENGHIIFSDRNFHISERKHKVFRGEVKGLSYIFENSSQSRQYIIAIGDDAKPTEGVGGGGSGGGKASAPLMLIKIFAVNDMSRPIQVLNAAQTDGLLTCFSVLNNGTQIAVGYSNGAVLHFQGNFLKEGGGQNPRSSQPTFLMQQHKHPISDLYFCELASPKPNERRIRLFVVLNSNANSTRLQQHSIAYSEDSSGRDSLSAGQGMDDDEIASAGIIVFDTSVTIVGGPPAGSATAAAAVAPAFTGMSSFIAAANRQPPRALDDRGAPPLSSTVSRPTAELLVGRSEAVYNFSVEDRGGAIAIFGEKQCICSAGRYTLLVSVEEKTPGGSAAGDGISSIEGVDNKPKRPNVNIFDLRNKIICGTAKKVQLHISEKVVYALHDSGVIFLVTSMWRLLRFKEKDTHRKLDVLLNVSGTNATPLYPLAITLAAEEQMEASEIMKLYKQFADYLHSKGDFDASVVQYVHTIGYVPPSYVVMKFLDPYRINNLILYLEKLLEKGLASKDLVTLLLASYTKVKDHDKLKVLLDTLLQKLRADRVELMKEATGNGSGGGAVVGNLDLNLATSNSSTLDATQAISVLFSSGFAEEALRLSAQCLEHGAYLDILMQLGMDGGVTGEGSAAIHSSSRSDGKNVDVYDEALGYLAYMPFVGASVDVLVAAMRQHGKALLQHRPGPFTALLVKMCTADYVSLIPTSHAAALNKTAAGKKKGAMVSSSASSSSPGSALERLGTELRRASNALFTEYVLTGATAGDKADAITAMLPRGAVPAVEMISLFTHDSARLLLFLEGVNDVSKGKNLPAKMAITMLELYLSNYDSAVHRARTIKSTTTTTTTTSSTTTASPTKVRSTITDLRDCENAIAELETNIMGILDGANALYDPAQALVLTSSYGFERGSLFLLEKQRAVELLALRLTDSGDGKELFRLLRREGNKDPELFVQVLTHFVKQTIVHPHDEHNIQQASPTSGRKGGRARGLSAAAEEDSDEQEDSEEDSDSEDDADDDDRWNSVMDVMDLVEKEGILSPMQVLSILAINPALPLHVASNFIQKTLRELHDDISLSEADVKVSRSNLEALNRMSAAAAAEGAAGGGGEGLGLGLESGVQGGGRVKSIRRSGDMTNPFGDYEDDEEEEESHQNTEEKERQKWQSIRKAQEECSGDHEGFYKDLELSPDGFMTVAAYFGRSIIS